MSIKLRFFWGNYLKHSSSMLIGTSPELELALFTLCYRTRPNMKCRVSLGENKFNIKTQTFDTDQDPQPLQSAFFNL